MEAASQHFSTRVSFETYLTNFIAMGPHLMRPGPVATELMFEAFYMFQEE